MPHHLHWRPLGKILLLAGLAIGGTISSIAQEAGPASPSRNAMVVLIDLSGFRWDYASRDGAKNLQALGKSGASAPQGMLPSFPASTWPNAWTIVTGLYPGHHGIVADHFYDPVRKAMFSGDDSKTVSDGRWYGGVPLWALAEKQGVSFACIDWPGCAAKVGRMPPSLNPDSKSYASAAEKMQQITDMLRLPDGSRPRLIVARLREVDEAGRRFGPDAPETRASVRATDAQLGRLRAAIDATHLRVDLVIVSDHGMAKPVGDWISLDALVDLSHFDSESSLLYASSDMDSAHAYEQLKKASSDFIAYRLNSAPADLHLFANPRFGDPVIIATNPIPLRVHTSDQSPPRGFDGLNAQTVPEMKGIFFAAGPDIVSAKVLAPFENVNIYPFIAHLLDLSVPKNDGSLNLLSGILRDGGETQQ